MRWTALAAGLLAAVEAHGAVLCQHRKSGRLALRDAACGRKEAVVDAATLGLANGAAGAVALAGATTATSPTRLDSFTVTPPGPGVLLVTVAGMLRVDADATTGNALTIPARIGLCDTPDSDAQCDGTYAQVWVQDADDFASEDTTPAFTVTRRVEVAAAGPRTFYVNGEAPSFPGAGIELWVDPIVGQGPVASAAFFPASLPVSRP